MGKAKDVGFLVGIGVFLGGQRLIFTGSNDGILCSSFSTKGYNSFCLIGSPRLFKRLVYFLPSCKETRERRPDKVYEPIEYNERYKSQNEILNDASRALIARERSSQIQLAKQGESWGDGILSQSVD